MSEEISNGCAIHKVLDLMASFDEAEIAQGVELALSLGDDALTTILDGVRYSDNDAGRLIPSDLFRRYHKHERWFDFALLGLVAGWDSRLRDEVRSLRIGPVFPKTNPFTTLQLERLHGFRNLNRLVLDIGRHGEPIDLSPLSGLTSLEHLEVHRQRALDGTIIPSSDTLISIKTAGTVLKPSGRWPSLENLDIHAARIAQRPGGSALSITGEGFPQLKHLVMRSTVSISQLPKLETVHVRAGHLWIVDCPLLHTLTGDDHVHVAQVERVPRLAKVEIENGCDCPNALTDFSDLASAV